MQRWLRVRVSGVAIALALAACSDSDPSGTGGPAGGPDVAVDAEDGRADGAVDVEARPDDGAGDATAGPDDAAGADAELPPEASDAPDHADSGDSGDAAGDGHAGPTACQSHADCDDDIECTGDTCAFDGTCLHTVAAGACLIAGACYAADARDPDNECQRCDPASSDEAWTARHQAACDDGDPCTAESACDKSVCVGVPAESCCGDGAVEGDETCDGDCPTACDDGDPCTTDTLVGHPDTCDARCEVAPLATCQGGDTCCPEGCDANVDGDCAPSCGNGVVESGEECDDGPAPDPASCTPGCALPGTCAPDADGVWVGDVYWLKRELTSPAACLEIYFDHAQALDVCAALGPGWKLPSIAQGDALLDALDAATEADWFPLSGNGGTTCQQMQEGGNGVWWLADHDGASGGAAIFCNAGGCYTTGTQMGDIYLYRVRCVQTDCEPGDGAAGCPALCAEDPTAGGDGRPTGLAWADNGTGVVGFAPLDTGAPATLADGQSYPLGIARDPLTDTVYWSDYTQKSIRRRTVPAGPILSFVTPGDNPAALAFEPVGRHLYWTETVGAALRRSDPDGGNPQTLVTGLSFSVGLDIDDAAGKLYWSEETPDLIRRADLDGSNVEVVVSEGLDGPRGLDVVGGQVYWADRGSQSVRRRAIAGGAVETVASGFLFVQDVDVDLDRQVAYVVDDGIGSPGIIYSVDLTTGTAVPFVTGLGTPKHAILWSD